MIEVNLIPDVKREYLHAQRVRNTVISVSMLVAAAAAGAVIVLGLALGSLQFASGQADNSIKSKYKELSDKPDINDLLTIQNQLTQIDMISSNRGVNSRIFDTLSAVNPQAPNNVTMSTVRYNASEKTITIEGSTAGGFNAVDALKKTILNTKLKYTKDSESAETQLSSSVRITNTAYAEDSGGEKKLTFTLTFSYPEELLSNSVKSLVIVSPTGSVDVTDSKKHVPDSLFEAKASNKKEDK
jgi:hypothetical protein cdiviTM7_02674